jgi:EmrB/QacA subfamily drug resistance transporter
VRDDPKKNSSNADTKLHEAPLPPEQLISLKNRIFIIVASLLALFLAALDALVMGAAMPSIVAHLGGLHLYSWAFSSYLLSRAVALPLFGKLCDLYSNKKLFNVSICIFLAGSVSAGISRNMTQLILARVIQGIGAGGSFALTYIVLSDISSPEKRGKMMSIASFVWGVASVLGPTIGGFIVNYFSWRWIFFINIPVGAVSLLGIFLYLIETREKREAVSIDYLGMLTLSSSILALLIAFLLAGRSYPWLSFQIVGLFAVATAAGVAFYHVEKRANEPIISIDFFKLKRFRLGNGAGFFASFAIFSLFSFSPLFIQGALGKTPAQLGLAMMPLSLGWSFGALFCGQVVNLIGKRTASILGGVLLVFGSAMTLWFSSATSLVLCSIILTVAGLGMGFVSIATLLVVQNSVDISNLGVATASHQFTRTLGGTIGIGISGSLVTVTFLNALEKVLSLELHQAIDLELLSRIQQNVGNIFLPEIQTRLSTDVQQALQEAVGHGVMPVFWASLLASSVCLVFAILLPRSDSFEW